jgi:hypothetical protein
MPGKNKDPGYDMLALTHAGMQWKQGADGLEFDALDVMAGLAVRGLPWWLKDSTHHLPHPAKP